MGRLAASILSADFGYLADQVKAVEPYADVLHVDVMDAHFVPPLTIGPLVVEALRPHTRLPLHCHLMIETPHKLFDDFQQKWITDWRPMIVCHANAVKTMVQGNVGGYEKSAGIWFGYRSNQEIRLRYLVDNGITAYKG